MILEVRRAATLHDGLDRREAQRLLAETYHLAQGWLAFRSIGHHEDALLEVGSAIPLVRDRAEQDREAAAMDVDLEMCAALTPWTRSTPRDRSVTECRVLATGWRWIQ